MSTLPPHSFSFYADEAGISRDRYTVVGGLTLRTKRLESVNQAVQEFREKYGIYAEMKWSKTSNQKVDAYLAFAELFFDLLQDNRIHFHCIIFDNYKANHKKFNDGSADVGLSKLYYQLILHKFIKKCGKNGNRLFACLDHRTSSTPLENVRKMLNAAASRDLGMTHEPLAQLTSADSKNTPVLQLNDLILGAVCSIRNKKHLKPETREAKKRLAEYVQRHCGLQRLDCNSPMSSRRFTVWNQRAQRS